MEKSILPPLLLFLIVYHTRAPVATAGPQKKSGRRIPLLPPVLYFIMFDTVKNVGHQVFLAGKLQHMGIIHRGINGASVLRTGCRI
jgi:hypothetical protein